MSDKSPSLSASRAPLSAAATAPKPGWREVLRVYSEAATLRMLLLGFSAGLPLLLVFGTLSFWLREAGIDRTTIGYLSWVGLAYGFKWAWAPLVDRLPIPLLTRWLDMAHRPAVDSHAEARFRPQDPTNRSLSTALAELLGLPLPA